MLPNVPLSTEIVDIEGTKVEVRSLSRSEVIRLQAMKGDPDEAEVFMLSRSLGAPEADVRVWRDNTPPMVVEELLGAIGRVSGLLDTPFQDNALGDAPSGD